ncbi:MAG: ACT domain-containing protein, partial [Planctomycetota bacterium]
GAAWCGSTAGDQDTRPAPGYELLELDTVFSVCRLPLDADIAWAMGKPAELVSIVRSTSEAQGTTVICDVAIVPEGVEADRGWHGFRFAGAFAFGETGVLESVLRGLADAGVPVLAVSTFETDYILVKAERVDRLKRELTAAGHTVGRLATS